MKGITACIQEKESMFHSVYLYDPEKKERKGGIYKRAADGSASQVEGEGAFTLSLKEESIFASECTGVSVYSTDLQKKKSLPIGVSYMHCTDGNLLYSSSSSGRYYSVDLEKETAEKKQIECFSSPCIHELWMVHKKEHLLFLGCDAGTFSAVDTRSNHTVIAHAFESGVTWIGEAEEDTISIGTYGGEYAVLQHLSLLPPKRIEGTIWRISPITYQRERALLLTQASDGISVRNREMEVLLQRKTEDLIYSAHVSERVITAHAYYSGEELSLSLLLDK